MAFSLLLTVVCIGIALGLVVGKQDVLKGNVNSTRGARNYDNFFNPDNLEDDSSNPGDDSDEPVYSDAPATGPSRVDGQFPGFDTYKGFWKPSPSYEQKYLPVKGFPYYVPYPKGDLSDFGNTGVVFPSQNQVAEMMAMMNKVQVPSKKQDQGIFAQLTSDPKNMALLAAVIPLSIMLASFIPLIINYFTSGTGSNLNSLNNLPSIVTSIANSKMARAFEDIETAEKLLKGIVDFGSKIMEDDECMQKTVCRVILQQGGVKNVKQVAVIINRLGKQDWLNTWGAKDILLDLEKGHCDHVCMKFNNSSSKKY